VSEFRSPRPGGALAVTALLVTPVLFSLNPVIGRAAVESVGPWTVAFLRWSLAAAVMLPLAAPALRQHAATLRDEWPWLVLLGALGMWVCGGVFYTALQSTTATNATLIYTTSPLAILLLERVLRGRPIRKREAVGIGLAVAGVIVLVSRGSPAVFANLSLNVGDLLTLVCAVAWALYTVVLRRPRLAALPAPALFVAIALSGAVLLAPFMVAETVASGAFPDTLRQWASIAGLVVFASVLAFLGYQVSVRFAGAAVSGLLMYLMPVSGVAMAVVFLGEHPGPAVLAGSLLVIGGLVTATAPIERLRAATTRA
jgi:drug/metabolite transporter (DMT)-like permease